MFKHIGLLLVAVVFAGCTSKSRPLPLDNQHRYIEGSILKVADENYKSYALEDCDRLYEKRVKALAKELDARHAQIKKLNQSIEGTDLPPEVRIAGYRFFDFKYEAKEPGWQTKRRGWKTLFDKIDKMPENKIDWLTIDRFVRAHIVDDESRLQYYGFPSLGRENQAMFMAAAEKVEKCYKSRCSNLNLSWEEEVLLKKGWAYREILYYYRTDNDSQEWLEILYKRTKAEAGRYQFRKNPKIKQTSQGVFAMPINPGELSKGIEMFSHFMRYWVDGAKRVNLIPKIGDNSQFKILMHSEAGRAHVLWEEKTVNLYPNETLKTIAHELGHVLGFKDTYYTSFYSNTCEYAVEFNGDDIMSDHNSGKVQAHHWETLNKAYPVAN